MAELRIPGIAPRTTLVAIALLAFLFVQSVAQVHVLRHLPGGPDGPALPGQHSQLCMDCVSHAPLLVVAGGVAVALLLACLALGTLPVASTAPTVERSRHPAFRSRAPPR